MIGRTLVVLLLSGGWGCTGSAAPTARATEEVETDTGDEHAVAGASSEALASVVALFDRLGAMPEAAGAPIVVAESWAGTRYCFLLDAEARRAVSIFGAACYVASPVTPLAWGDVRAHATNAVQAVESTPAAQRHQMLAAVGSVAPDVAALARAADHAGHAAVARAILAQALAAPHESLPEEAATAMRRLEGDIALAALHDALQRYEQDPTMDTAALRARLAAIAELDGLEAAAHAARLVPIVRRMEQAVATDPDGILAQLVNQTYALYQVVGQSTAAEAMPIVLPLLESDLRVRQIDRNGGGRSDLRTVGAMALEAASQIAGQTFVTPGAVRSWWAANEADGGVGEAWTTLERVLTEHSPRTPIDVFVRRVMKASDDDPLRRLEALHRRGSPTFRQMLLGAIDREAAGDAAAYRRMVRRSLQSANLSEVNTAAQVLLPDDEESLAEAERRFTAMALQADDEGDYERTAALAALAYALLAHGRPASVLRHWSTLGHRLRENLARSMPASLEPAAAAPVLLDEGTLLVDASAECAAPLAADRVAHAIATSRGVEYDCGAAPLERRAAREELAGRETPEPREITTTVQGRLTVHYEGPAELRATLLEAVDGATGTPAELRSLLATLVSARASAPTIVAMVLRAVDGELEIEIRVRGANSRTPLQAIGIVLTPDGQTEYVEDVAGPVMTPDSPLFHGVGPFRPLLPTFEDLLGDAPPPWLVLQLRW